MGIFNVFKKKPKAPVTEPALKQELTIPAPPLPPGKGFSKELPGFPKYEMREDKTPHLPSFSPELKHSEPVTIIHKPPKVEPITKPSKLEENFPNISPYELEPEPVPKRVEAQKPVLGEKPSIRKFVEERPHYEQVVGEVRRTLHKPKSFVKKPIFVNIEDYMVLLNDISNIRKSLSGLKLSVAKLNSLKDKEDAEYKKWQQILDDMKKKFLFVDETLFESKG